MGAFCVAGGEELLAVSWREWLGVEMGGYGFVRDLAKEREMVGSFCWKEAVDYISSNVIDVIIKTAIKL